MSRFKTLFSYYGGKSKIAHLYPPPQFDHIIEPFAGGAGYALRYHDRKVTLIDKNPATVAMWRYLLENSLETVLRDLPETVSKGQKVSALLPSGAPPGLAAFLAASASVGEAGSYCFADRSFTGYGTTQWPRVRERVAYFLPRIRHWTVIEGTYRDAPDVEATWYVDPPYSNRLGQRYFCKDVDFKDLAQFCTTRKGQTIVCENEGATWLPFEKLVEVRNLRNKSVEVVWCGSSTTASSETPPSGSTTSGSSSESITPSPT